MGIREVWDRVGVEPGYLYPEEVGSGRRSSDCGKQLETIEERDAGDGAGVGPGYLCTWRRCVWRGSGEGGMAILSTCCRHTLASPTLRLLSTCVLAANTHPLFPLSLRR